MRARHALAPLFVLSALACECGPQVQTFEPTLDVSTEALDFQLVAIGDSAVQNVRLRALTPADLTLLARLDGTGPFKIEGQVPELIPGNDSVELSVSFTPTEATVYDGTLVVETNDPNPSRGKRRILLAGEGKSPEIRVTPDHLDLSAIACPPSARSPRCKDTQTVVLENVGLVDLTLQTLEIQGVAAAQPPPNLRFGKLVNASTLAPGGRLEVPIEWKPAPAQAPSTAGADFKAVLVIPSNDPRTPRIEVALNAHADANAPPSACAQVLAISKRMWDLDANGRPIVVTRPVPEGEWRVDCAAPGENCGDTGFSTGDVRVRPGMNVTVTSLRRDPAEEASNPCTADREGDELTRAWVLDRPRESRASLTPSARAGVLAADASFDVDAVGTYDVSLQVHDSLRLLGTVATRIKAIPRDDLFVQLGWSENGDDARTADLDLHVLADAGPNLSGPADFFCEQDTFFANRVMTLFGPAQPPLWPQVVQDDQGEKGQLETATLTEAPAGSRFRIGVHYYASSLGLAAPVFPKLMLRVKGVEKGPYGPTSALAATGQGWLGVEVEFPAHGQPVVRSIDVRRTGLAFDAADGVGACP